jgi:hypothetical protein
MKTKWTWKEVAKELLKQGDRIRARLDNLGHYSEGWDVVATFAAEKLKKKDKNERKTTTNDPSRCRRGNPIVQGKERKMVR